VPYSLEHVDLVRERMGVGYAEAKRALDEADGDVVGALADIETRLSAEPTTATLEGAISRLGKEVKAAIAGRPITGLRVKLADQTLTEVPVALGGMGAVLLAAVSSLLAFARVELATGGETTGNPTDSESA